MKCRLVNDNFKKDYVNNLLRARGINDVERYYNPDSSCLQDPCYLENIAAGAELLNKTIKQNSKILIVVD